MRKVLCLIVLVFLEVNSLKSCYQWYGEELLSCKMRMAVQMTNTTRQEKELQCLYNSNFVLERDDFLNVSTIMLECSAEFPLDLRIEFSHPPEVDETSILLPIKTYWVNSTFATVYHIFAKYIYTKKRPITSMSRFVIYNPLNTTLSHTINYYQHGPESSGIIYNGTKKVCLDESGQTPLLLPCVASYPDAQIKLNHANLGLSSYDKEYLTRKFTYDPGLGFMFTESKYVLSPGNEFFCESGKTKLSIEISNSSSPYCKAMRTTKKEDVNGLDLECTMKLRNTRYYYLICHTSRRMEVRNSKIIKSNQSLIGPNWVFMLTIAFSENPTSAQKRKWILNSTDNNMNNHRRQKVFKKGESYQMDILDATGFGRFESDFHYIDFQYFTDLDGIKRLLPKDYNTLNKSHVMRLTKMSPCSQNQTATTADLYSTIKYCFQCEGITYLIPRGASWHLILQNGTTEFIKMDPGILLKGSNEIVYKMNTTLDSTIRGVMCSTSFWNGDTINSSRHFSVTNVKFPKIVNKSNKTIVLEENNSSPQLVCKAEGIPIPTIQWMHNDTNLTNFVEISYENGTIESRVQFHKVHEYNSGIYSCIAKNFAGKDETKFVVRVRPGLPIVKENNNLTVIMISISFAIIVVLVVGIIIIRELGMRQPEKNKIVEDIPFESGMTKIDQENDNIFSDLPSMKIRNEVLDSDIKILEMLDYGTFGVVYKACVVHKIVAAKFLHQNPSPVQFFSFLQEIQLMDSLGTHENIVTMIGAHTSKYRRGKLILFLEYCPLGSLQKYLRSRKYDSGDQEQIRKWTERGYHVDGITVDQMKLWIFQVTNGMAYLSSKKIIHADLATRNILLSSESNIKITDFGMSLKVYEHMTYHRRIDDQEPIPMRWMSIEALQSLKFSEFSDIWAFGIVMWEIFSFADVPYANWPRTCQEFQDRLENGDRLECPALADEFYYNIMQRCWSASPDDRPTFHILTEELALPHASLT